MRSAVVTALFLFVGCQRSAPTATTPDGAFRLFASHLEQEQFKPAYRLLSEKSRGAVESRLKALSEASRGLIDHEGAVLLETARRLGRLEDVSVVEAGETRAVIEVRSCNQPPDATGGCPKGAAVAERVNMVREGAGWAVELSELVAP